MNTDTIAMAARYAYSDCLLHFYTDTFRVRGCKRVRD